MIDYYSLPESELPMSMRYLRKVLRERGWKAEKLCREGGNNLILTQPDGKVVKVASSTPPTTSVYALRLADNKLMSYALMKDLGVPQPETRVATGAEEIQKMLGQYGTIVIKPADGAHGRGVTAGITEVGEALTAREVAIKASPEMKLAIMQPQLAKEALETRVICIDYKFVVAIARIPARVTGDGERNLRELIEYENKTLRAEPYQGNLAYIDMKMAEKFLGERVSEVPAKGEKVRVVASCNVGQGGTAEDYSAKLTPERIAMSERIARAAELPVIGIDFYGAEVIEVNACPSLYYPTGDATAVKAVEAYVDYLGRI